MVLTPFAKGTSAKPELTLAHGRRQQGRHWRVMGAAVAVHERRVDESSLNSQDNERLYAEMVENTPSCSVRISEFNLDGLDLSR